MEYPVRYAAVDALRRMSTLVLIGAIFLLAGNAGAQGVTADSITLGQSASLTGPSEELTPNTGEVRLRQDVTVEEGKTARVRAGN